MHIKKLLFCLGALAVLFVSCDKDYNELGSGILGDEDYYLGQRQDWTVQSATSATGVVQSNNLPINPLGIYNDPVFGKLTANFVTQVELASENPTIGTNPTVTDVVLKIPYFSTALGTTNDEGHNEYELDSIYQTGTGRFKLEIYRSGFFLRNQEVGSGGNISTQFYYTDENSLVDNAKIGTALNNATDVAENNEFFFDPAELRYTEGEGEDAVTTTEAPAMEIHLSIADFQSILFTNAGSNLASNNAFKEYFRGLYFKVTENNSANTALSMLDFTDGEITVTYNVANATAGEDPVERTMVLNLAGNSVSLQQRESAFSPQPGQLALLGGNGYTSEINILDPAQLQVMRDERWLINEASLVFFVDQSAMQNAVHEPKRLYLYSLDHKQALLDYLYDNTTLSDVKYNKFIYGGILEDDEDGRGYRYKFRVTNYVRSLITNDSTNVRLGLAVTESIANSTMARKKSGAPSFPNGSDYLPTASVMHPLGTILYGADATDESKRLKLTVYYTKPD